MRATTAAPGLRQSDTIKIATSMANLRASLGLAYDAYRKGGLTTPNSSRMRITPYHLLATTEVFLGVDESGPVCTLSMVHDGKLGLPMENTFSGEIAELREAGFRCAEGSCLAYRLGGSETSFATVAKLMSFAIQCAAHREFDYILLAVHPRHAPFYCRFYGAEYLADGAQPHEAVHGSPAVALKFNLKQLPPAGSRSYKRIFAVRHSATELKYRPLRPAVLAELERLYVQDNARETVPFTEGRERSVEANRFDRRENRIAV